MLILRNRFMRILETLQKEIEDSQKRLVVQKGQNSYRRDLRKRIELINWVLEHMKKPDIKQVLKL